MKIVTADQMRTLDRRAIEETGISGAVLMENAGRAVVSVMQELLGSLAGKRIAIFCGSGNNGGDGFVIARYLKLANAAPWICMVGDVNRLSPDASLHYRLAQQTLALCPDAVLTMESSLWQQKLSFQTDVIVDALLGTGSAGEPRGGYATAIHAINQSGTCVFAVDIPSGVHADTGETPGAVVRATHTVTFAYPKLGLLLFPGAEYVGALHVQDIGFPWNSLAWDTPLRLVTAPGFDPIGKRVSVSSPSLGPVTPTFLVLTPRKAESNKGDYGHVAVVAGSRGMTGAPAMVARAAQRAGAGLVTVLAPSSAQSAISIKLDEQMTLSLPEEDGAAAEVAYETIAKFAEKATVFCVGPGMTTSPGTVALVHRILVNIKRPIILDADGLNALAMKPDVALERASDIRNPLILTPHPGEAARLLGTSIAEVQSNRIEFARELARRYRAVVVLKGRHSLIAAPEGIVYVNTSGNPGMATGGSGDTLTGILGGLLAQAVAAGKGAEDDETYKRLVTPPEQVVASGVYIHGLAGDLAAEHLGEIGLVAGDLTANLPAAIRLLEESR